MIKNLFEGKQVGILYHLLNFDQMKFMIENNKLKSQNFFNGISFTRDKTLNNYIGSRPIVVFKIEVDGNKLSNKYKIEPFQYISSTNVIFSEFEEIVRTTEIKDIFKYINKIIFIANNIERDIKYMSNWIRKTNINILLNKIKFKIPFYVQVNNKFVKDYNYLKEKGFI